MLKGYISNRRTHVKVYAIIRILLRVSEVFACFQVCCEGRMSPVTVHDAVRSHLQKHRRYIRRSQSYLLLSRILVSLLQRRRTVPSERVMRRVFL